ncbi:MAG: MBL fold metallo-hydrolase [Candidatus Parvarchaeota archaeon]|nr:MBL fold metallo-hydrolase [Candidatus Parvarchaeota archaeon]
MDIKFLGRWSSNIIRNQRNISFVLDNKIAFDFGPHALESLLDLGIDPSKITTLLITHMHLDHYAGIAELLWYRSIHKAKDNLLVFGPKGIESNTYKLMKVLKTPENWYKEQIDTKIKFIEDKGVDSIQVFHAHHLVPDNGYRVEHKGKIIFYSGDTAYSPAVVEGASGVDVLLHEMTYTDKDRKAADFWRHSTYSDVMRVFRESRAKRLVPVHLSASSSAFVTKVAGRVDGIVYPPEILEL